MRFQGRDRAEGGRTGLVRRARRSVRLVPQALSTGSSPAELLESRLLLSVFGGGGRAISFEPLPVNRAFVVPVDNTVATLSVHARDSSPSSTNPYQPWAQPVAVSGGGDAGQVAGEASAPSLMLIKTVSQFGLASSGMLVVTTTRTGNLGESSIPPVIVMSPSLSSSSYPRNALAPPYDSTGSTTSTSWDQSNGWASGESAGAPSSSMTSTTSVAALPDARNLQYEGTWTGPQGTTAFQLPVGPMTHEVGVTIRPGPMADSPILAGLTLLDKDGDKLASIAPLWNSQTNSPIDAITITLNGAPVGGTLVVQLASPQEGSVAGSPATNSPGAVAVPFTMDVQRIDALANSGNPAGQGSLTGLQPGSPGSGLGTLQWMTNQASLQNSNTTSSGSENTPLSATPLFVTDPTLDTTVADGPSTLVASEDSADLRGRIPLGPLASRSAAPMGPNLVSAWLDVAPAVDRHERGVSQAIEDRLSDDDLPDDDIADLSIYGGAVLASAGERTRPVDTPHGESEDAPAGLGPMPLRTVDSVASVPVAADVDDLLAALTVTLRHERSAPTRPDDLGATLGLLDTASHDADADPRPAPDYLTTAFVLALGMGLTTGPMLPDLMRLIPKRGGRPGFVPAGAARHFPRAQPRPRLFGDGLRRPTLLASRQAD